MQEPIITVSGLRGIIGESLTPEIAIRYACAFTSDLPPGPVVVTRDSRPSGQLLAQAIGSGLRALGREVINAGIAATPTTGVLIQHLGAAGGVQISASHNPPPYNGMKLFSAEGRVLPASAGQQVIERYRGGQFAWVSHEKLGTATTCEDPTGEHLRRVLETVDVEAIKARGFHVLLDANHGAGSVLGRPLLEALGCETTLLGPEPDGQFAHVPEPTAENLAGVLAKVTELSADVGFCQDPDADRLAVIDEKGRYIGEEYTLAMCVDHRLRQQHGPIVTNCSTSRMSEALARSYGVPFHKSAVGEANVVDVMLAEKALLGGEGNGGVIDPRVGLVRDSFAGMALLLDAMTSRNLTVSALADELPRFEIVKTKITLDRDKIAHALEQLASCFRDAEANRTDGLRLDWPDGRWLLVRPSNTEPIVRAIAEAPTAAAAQELCQQAADEITRID